MSKIKICGLTRLEDILAVNPFEPDYIGFVFAKSRRQVSREQAAALSEQLNPKILKVGVFVDQEAAVIAEYLQAGVIDIAQLHGNETEAVICRLKAETGKPVIKAVSVQTLEDILAWQDSMADYLLLDHGKGGTGVAFNWDILRRLEGIGKPYFLAGGLTIDNMEDALAYQPFALDISSGVEISGRKDQDKIAALMIRLRLLQDEKRKRE